MMKQIMATKSHMTQAWTKSGVRVPVTVVTANDCYVISSGKKEDRILVGQGTKKLHNVKKPQRNQLEKAGLSLGFRQVKELMVETGDKENLTAGTKISPSQVLKVGDVVKVTGKSKGKGFTGVVKRHGFKGGPRTHGQSDRERAPGSIGSGTTPGRVYKNKRMAGRSGNENVSVLGLRVVGLNDQTGEIMLKGIVPGAINGLMTITKTGEAEFEGLLESMVEIKEVETAPVAETPVEEKPIVAEESKPEAEAK
jgi:large subunit ribosomal protein L3